MIPSFSQIMTDSHWQRTQLGFWTWAWFVIKNFCDVFLNSRSVMLIIIERLCDLFWRVRGLTN